MFSFTIMCPWCLNHRIQHTNKKNIKKKKRKNPDVIWCFFICPERITIWISNGHELFILGFGFGLSCTCISRNWSPISRSMFLDVRHQDDVFFRCPRTLLDANFITARRPSHDYSYPPPSSPPAFPMLLSHFGALSMWVFIYLMTWRKGYLFFTVDLPPWLTSLFYYFFQIVNYTIKVSLSSCVSTAIFLFLVTRISAASQKGSTDYSMFNSWN